ncbi:hypothetical protein [Paraburkholderia sp. BR13444]|uniref:hypothetical protein n=1 Tax=Paraburkholderia sp. BR13444 TaxID=3236997 RepID=UPI0034CE06CD
MRLFFRRSPRTADLGGDGDDDRSSSVVSEREVNALASAIADGLWPLVCQIDRERAAAGLPLLTAAELEEVFGDDAP